MVKQNSPSLSLSLWVVCQRDRERESETERERVLLKDRRTKKFETLNSNKNVFVDLITLKWKKSNGSGFVLMQKFQLSRDLIK
jgi:hypothetical protein